MHPTWQGIRNSPRLVYIGQYIVHPFSISSCQSCRSFQHLVAKFESTSLQLNEQSILNSRYINPNIRTCTSKSMSLCWVIIEFVQPHNQLGVSFSISIC